MTLVVARQSGENVCIVSDTCITFGDGRKRTPELRALKTPILRSDLCVGFAGNLAVADEAVSALPDTVRDRNAIVAHFLASHLRHSGSDVNGTDFIVAFGPPDSHFVAIKGGVASRMTSAWIGAATAFARFQEYSLWVRVPSLLSPTTLPNGHIVMQMNILECPDNADDNGKLLGQMHSAMLGVVNDGLAGVNGFAVPVSFVRGRFRFVDYATLLSHPIQLPQELSPLPTATTAQGGYAISFSGDDEDQTPFCASVYCPLGNFGVLFWSQPNHIPESIAFLNTPALDFEEEVYRGYHRTVNCMFLTYDHYWERGLQREEEKQYDVAARHFAKAMVRGPSSAWHYTHKGVVEGMRGNLLGAIADFSIALSLDSRDTFAYYNRAYAYRSLGQRAAAIADLDQLLLIEPGHELARQLRNELTK
jgi:hypothetical protein